MKTLSLLGCTLAMLCVAPTAQAESLLLQNADRGHALAAPKRGLSMAEVERRYGAPLQKLASVGGSSAKQPPINRWRYADYTVVFERTRVIHSVAHPG